MNVGLLNNINRSSIDLVGSGTIPNIAIRTAPPAMRIVPMAIHLENTSPRIIRAKRAFHSKETAPKGARITTGRDAIWNKEPNIFEEMKIAKRNGQSELIGVEQGVDVPKPNSHKLDSFQSELSSKADDDELTADGVPLSAVPRGEIGSVHDSSAGLSNREIERRKQTPRLRFRLL